MSRVLAEAPINKYSDISLHIVCSLNFTGTAEKHHQAPSRSVIAFMYGKAGDDAWPGACVQLNMVL